MVEEVKKGIRGIRVPTKRVGDTIGDDLFKKKVMQAGFDSLSDFNQTFKAAGGDLGDAANKTKFLNSYLPKEEAPYRNIITDRIKTKYEMLSGGAKPGTVGAPENKVYWQAASAAEKEAMEKFPKDTKVNKQKRLTYVKRYLKNAGVPAKWLLNNLPKMGLYATAGAAAPISALATAMLYAGTSKPAMGALPEESLKDKVLRDIDFSAPSANAQLLEQMSQDAVMKAGGGMMNMDDMIRPVGFANGGDTIIPKEKPSPDIKPKEKPVNFKAIMAEFDTPENKAGPGEPTGIEKIIADQFEIDPRFTMKQRVKEMLGMGGDQGSSNFADQLELEIIKLESTIKSLITDEVLTGTDNSRSIQGNQNLLEYYRSLR